MYDSLLLVRAELKKDFNIYPQIKFIKWSLNVVKSWRGSLDINYNRKKLMNISIEGYRFFLDPLFVLSFIPIIF
jgi:hypothetical protein